MMNVLGVCLQNAQMEAQASRLARTKLFLSALRQALDTFHHFCLNEERIHNKHLEFKKKMPAEKLTLVQEPQKTQPEVFHLLQKYLTEVPQKAPYSSVASLLHPWRERK